MFILLFVRFIQVVNLQIIKLSKVKLYWFQCIPQVHDISSTDALFYLQSLCLLHQVQMLCPPVCIKFIRCSVL